MVEFVLQTSRAKMQQTKMQYTVLKVLVNAKECNIVYELMASYASLPNE
jgi:hypothetical protein